MSRKLVEAFAEDLIDVVVVSQEAQADGNVSFWDRVRIGKEIIDLPAYLVHLTRIRDTWLNMSEDEKLNTLISLKGKLFDKGIISKDLEELIDISIEWCIVTIKLFNKGRSLTRK